MESRHSDQRAEGILRHGGGLVDSMIGIKEAVSAAVSFVKEAYEGEKLSNLGLEEIELSDDEKFWFVTLGFSRPWDFPKKSQSLNPYTAPLTGLLQKPDERPDREYKVFKVDVETGHVRSMKMLDE